MTNIENLFTPQELENLCCYYEAEKVIINGGCIVAMTSTVVIKRWELTEAPAIKAFIHKRGRKSHKMSTPKGYIGCLYPVAITYKKVEWRVKIKPYYSTSQQDRIAEEWLEKHYECIVSHKDHQTLRAFLESKKEEVSAYYEGQEALSKWEAFLKNNM